MRKNLLNILLLTLILTIFHPSSALPQSHFDKLVFGYSTNLPKEVIGLSVFSIHQNKTGYWGDIKWSPGALRSGNDDYYDNISRGIAENTWNDPLLSEKEEWISLNFGLTRGIAAKTAIYGGVGVAQSYHYRQYYDSFQILGNNGQYWIADESQDKTYPNIIIGLLFLVSDRVTLNIGTESVPNGIDFGIGYSFF